MKKGELKGIEKTPLLSVDLQTSQRLKDKGQTPLKWKTSLMMS
jgi:hypothetical protein